MDANFAKQYLNTIRSMIQKSGQAVQAVTGEIPFAYTIGNYERGLPELLVIGVAIEPVHQLLNELGRKMRDSGQPIVDGQLLDTGGRVKIKAIRANRMAHEHYTLMVGRVYETDDYEVMQILIPDLDGNFPGDENCDPAFAAQPVLRIQ